MKIMLTKDNIFSTTRCSLGEGLLWHPQRQSLLWLDIIEKKIFEKKIASNTKTFDSYWDLDEIGSALVLNTQDDNSIFIITDKSLGQFCLKTGVFSQKVSLNFPENMRANDGNVSPDGHFWFGSMEKKPSGVNGAIYSISPQGELVKRLDNIGIPNTFCWDKSGQVLYLSDSYQQKMFKCHLTSDKTLETNKNENFIDLTVSSSTPDGGALDTDGNLWNAHWDGHKVQCYSPTGEELDSICLPVPQVTNCCFGGPKNQHLFISTASENLTETSLLKYPFSGAIFVVELGSSGQGCFGFTLDIN